MRKTGWGWAMLAIGIIATGDATAATFVPWQRLHAPQVGAFAAVEVASGAAEQDRVEDTGARAEG